MARGGYQRWSRILCGSNAGTEVRLSGGCPGTELLVTWIGEAAVGAVVLCCVVVDVGGWVE